MIIFYKIQLVSSITFQAQDELDLSDATDHVRRFTWHICGESYSFRYDYSADGNDFRTDTTTDKNLIFVRYH